MDEGYKFNLCSEPRGNNKQKKPIHRALPWNLCPCQRIALQTCTGKPNSRFWCTSPIKHVFLQEGEYQLAATSHFNRQSPLPSKPEESAAAATLSKRLRTLKGIRSGTELGKGLYVLPCGNWSIGIHFFRVGPRSERAFYSLPTLEHSMISRKLKLICGCNWIVRVRRGLKRIKLKCFLLYPDNPIF